ncbi:hypothetical protein LG634_32750 [Streptomyces bambusae]|uniref:hypothetical protein n=1 Tax=Streptomyces bambusae TaxID=1550616 RepID=UPI001CFF922C|nr:hypothetical protein [Streptomyces bambusae]MCB5169564.1 hypothetical protein [Streptomyces bambusae]
MAVQGGARRAWQVAAGVFAAGLIGCLVAMAAVDLDKADKMASVIGAVVSVIALAVSLWVLTRPEAPAPQTGARSVQADVIGRAITGDNNVVTGQAPQVPAPTTPPAAAPGGDLARPGDRGVVGRTVGEAITGDGNQTRP